MYELTEEWLERINEEFRRKDIPHKQRPWLALDEWVKYTGNSVALNDEEANEIFAWFEKNTKAGSQHFGPMYMGVLYYDSCFWPIYIPVIGGIRRVNTFTSLKTMPETIKARLMADSNEVVQYVLVWTDCYDYAYGIERLSDADRASGFAQNLFKSGDQQLNATVTLLLEDRPNPKAMESARMATEMFLKAYLASTVGLTDEEARTRIRHDLQTALDECLAVDTHSELHVIRPELSCFPEVGDRYRGTDKTSKELWQAYSLAQFTGTTVVRSLTGRDIRKYMR